MNEQLRSAEWNELAAALAKAQGQMENAKKDRDNPHFKSRYADLAAVRDVSIPALSANGICLVQQVGRDRENGGLMLTTTLVHSSGQWLASELPIPQLQRIQELGSYLTYARRYTWMGLCGVAPEDDDDGNEANAARVPGGSGRKPPPPAKNVMVTPGNGEPPHDPETGEVEPDDRQKALVSAVVHLGEVEASLARAAALGTSTLRTAWANLDRNEKAHFKPAMDERFKVIAQEADLRQEEDTGDDIGMD